MMPASHLETALQNVRRIVATASLPSPPITVREALEQITETLDLAGYGVGPEEEEEEAAPTPRPPRC